MTYAGMDVCKASISVVDGEFRFVIENKSAPIRRMLAGLKAGSIVVEATGKYHRKVTRLADALGKIVYLVNPQDFSNYREAFSYRAKTDPIDAEMLARYGRKEHDELRPWHPDIPEMQQVRELLGFRTLCVDKVVAIRLAVNAAEGMPARFIRSTFGPVIEKMEEAIHETDLKIKELLKGNALYVGFLRMKGIGPLTAAALCWVFSKGPYKSDDAAVAFIGFDVQVRESGRYKGMSKLTKRGDPLVRRFLYEAANSLRKNKDWLNLMLPYQARGLSKIQTNVVFARKLLRIAYAVATYGVVYDEKVALTGRHPNG